MRIPLTLLLGLSLLVQSLPLTALADDGAVGPVAPVEAPIEPAPVVEEPVEPAPTTIEPATEPAPAPVEQLVEAPLETPVAIQQVEMPPVEPMLLADAPTYIDITGAIDLPNGCEMADDSGTIHLFPVATTTEYLAVCALAEALDEDIISEVTVSSNSFGLFVSSINGVPAGTNEYWAIWINDGYANCGVSCQTLASGDEIAFVRTSYDPVTYAETPMDRIEINVSSLEDTHNNIIVPDACSVTDISGASHTYPAGDDLLGICALVAAKAEGYVSGFELTDASFGLFVSSLDGIDAGTNEYWAIWINDGYANCGVSCQTLASGDEIAFVRTSYDPVTYAETQHEHIALRVIGGAHVETDDTEGGNTGGTGGGDEEDGFDVSKAFSYLAGIQDANGSIENDLVTDWAAVAFSSSGAPANAKSLLKEYLRNEEIDMDNTSDYLRHAMAMLALNLNPYSAGPEDYVTPIVESFDGTQLGEDEYINDDIFALIVLPHVGYDEDDQLIKDVAAFVLEQQQGDGSWVGGIDMTAAAVQALVPLSSLPGADDAIERAEAYLRSKQESDGGFGDTFATAWVLQAVHALGDSPTSWEVSGNDPLEYLTSKQKEDGSMTTSSGTSADAAWATVYAIAAAKGETWDELLDSVRKQEPAEDTKSDDKDEDEKTGGEVLGVEDTIPAEPLAPAFTFEAPAEIHATTPSARTISRTDTAEDAMAPAEESPAEQTEESETQTASVGDAEGSSWLMRTVAAFWEGLLSFFRNLFS